MSSPSDSSGPKPIPLPRHWGLGEILSAKHNRSVVKTLVLFTVAMVALPIGTFFTFHDFLLVDKNFLQRHGGGAGCQHRHSGIRHRGHQRRRGRGRRESTDRCALENGLIGQRQLGMGGLWRYGRTGKSRADAPLWGGGLLRSFFRSIEFRVRGVVASARAVELRYCVLVSCTRRQ